jgi:hypothetical protein
MLVPVAFIIVDLFSRVFKKGGTQTSGTTTVILSRSHQEPPPAPFPPKVARLLFQLVAIIIIFWISLTLIMTTESYSTDAGHNGTMMSRSSLATTRSSSAAATAYASSTNVTIENAAELSFAAEFDADIQILSNAQVAVILQMSAQNALAYDTELNEVYKKTQKYVERYNTMKNPEKDHQELVDELDNLQKLSYNYIRQASIWLFFISAMSAVGWQFVPLLKFLFILLSSSSWSILHSSLFFIIASLTRQFVFFVRVTSSSKKTISALTTFRKETEDGRSELELHGFEVAALMNLVATDTMVEEAVALIPSLARFPESAIDEILESIRSTMIRIVSYG